MRFSQGPYLCVGADPHEEILQSWGLEISANGLREFTRLFLEALPEEVQIVKPQVSLFEAFGSQGFSILESFLVELRAKQIYVIADAKRSDIGTSMQGYARGWLRETSPFVADAITASPYLGVASLGETIATANANNRMVFVLVATSNPEAKSLQENGLAKSVLNDLIELKADGIGVVIGATVDLHQYDLNELLGESDFPILAPGFGSQGASLADIPILFGQNSNKVLANVSRSVLKGSPEKLSARIKAALSEVQ